MTQEALYRMARQGVQDLEESDWIWHWTPRFPEKDPLIAAIERVHRQHQVEMMTIAICQEQQLLATVALIQAVRRQRQLEFDLAEPS